MKNFNSIGEFITHIAVMEAAEVLSLHNGLKKCSLAIEKTAKDEIGHYQPDVGAFPAWVGLADSTLKHHESMGVGDTPLIVTGGLYASISHEINGLEAVIGSTADEMVWNELGTSRIPPRPVLGPAGVRNKDLVLKTLGHAVAEGLLYGSGASLTALE